GSFYWESHPNMGQAATLNKGWAMAKGEVLGYLSADDVLLPEGIEVLVNALQESQGAVAVYGDFLLINEHGKNIGEVRCKAFDYARMISHLHCPIGPGALFRRELFDTAGGWNVRLRLVPDYDFWLRVGHFGSIIHVPFFVAQWRVHACSQTNSCADRAQADEVIDVMDWYYKDDRYAREAPVARNDAMAQAYFFCAGKHIAAGRYAVAWKYIRCAWGLSHASYCSMHVWRLVLGSFWKRVQILFHRVARG
ncbi:glycosyltransferase, partial [Candidatus Parcubacteria bacterium]